MKLYTDIEQSKNLVEILPIESADMLWGYYYNGKNHCIPNIRPFRDGRNEIPKGYIPAWSLASLLSILPNGIGLFKTVDGEFYCLSNDYMTNNYDNPIDACYELILKLSELNLL